MMLATAGRSHATTLPSQQITPSDDGISRRWNRNNSTTSAGQILFVDSNETVYLFDGTTIQTVQLTDGNAVETSSFGLGSASTAGHVIGAWRRGAQYLDVSIDGGTPQRADLNPEALAIGEGCVFSVMQVPDNGNHAFEIDPANGNRTQLSSGTPGANFGAGRVNSSGCSKAAWTYFSMSGGPFDIQYWNGTSVTTVATEIEGLPSFTGGKIVYVKIVDGIQQVFVIDTDVSLTPVQLSAETDPTKTLERPQTDGRHVAWYRRNTNGTSPETAQIILNGGLAFPTGPLAPIDPVNFSFQLNRGQLLWKNASGTFSYDDGRQTFGIDLSPATTFEFPWLTDGFIAFLGLTPTGGATKKDVFRITATAPDDGSQPLPPMLVAVTAGTGQVKWDSILGATSYNAYVALAPGVTKDNYTSLPGGQKFTGVTSGFNVTGISPNTTYYVAITAIEGATEGPSSRVASAFFVGNLTWQPVGGLTSTSFQSVAADPANASYVYAGSNGAVYRSVNGGIDWTPVLTNATTGGTNTAALAVSGMRVWASMMSQGDIWRTPDRGTTWSRVLDASADQTRGSLAIHPINPDILYAGNFTLPGMTVGDSPVIKSITGGDSWFHTPFAPLSEAFAAATIAIDPTTPTILYAGSNNTPNVARSNDGAGSWSSAQITGGGEVRSLAIDPTNPNTIYASTRDKGVFKSFDAGGVWTAKNNGLEGVSETFFGGASFNSLLVDPTNPNLLHLGAGNGYWLSVDAGETWFAANDGFGGSGAWINALAITPGRHVIAATDTGLYLLSLAAAPTVTNVTPAGGNVGGGTVVTITGSGFESGATVTFGGAAATNVNVVSATTITATTPPHASGVVAVAVTNPDNQSGTMAGAFNYTNAPGTPTGVSATAQTTTSILVSWSGSAGATSYQVHRRITDGTFQQIATPATTSFTDTVAAGAAYAYFVRAVNGSGASANSAIDVATTITFTNHPLSAGVAVKAAHLAQLRTAVNAVRSLANLGAAGFTDSATAGVIVKAVHITEIRSALDTALTQLGVALNSYTNATLNGLAVKAVHIQEIRSRLE